MKKAIISMLLVVCCASPLAADEFYDYSDTEVQEYLNGWERGRVKFLKLQLGNTEQEVGADAAGGGSEYRQEYDRLIELAQERLRQSMDPEYQDWAERDRFIDSPAWLSPDTDAGVPHGSDYCRSVYASFLVHFEGYNASEITLSKFGAMALVPIANLPKEFQVSISEWQVGDPILVEILSDIEWKPKQNPANEKPGPRRGKPTLSKAPTNSRQIDGVKLTNLRTNTARAAYLPWAKTNSVGQVPSFLNLSSAMLPGGMVTAMVQPMYWLLVRAPDVSVWLESDLVKIPNGPTFKLQTDKPVRGDFVVVYNSGDPEYPFRFVRIDKSMAGLSAVSYPAQLLDPEGGYCVFE